MLVEVPFTVWSSVALPEVTHAPVPFSAMKFVPGVVFPGFSSIVVEVEGVNFTVQQVVLCELSSPVCTPPKYIAPVPSIARLVTAAGGSVERFSIPASFRIWR